MPEKKRVTEKRGTESGTIDGEIARELAEVVKAWPDLPADVQASILASVRLAGKGRQQ